jgi:hypothetical protein
MTSPVILPISARCGFFSSSFASAADSAGGATLIADEVWTRERESGRASECACSLSDLATNSEVTLE